MSKKRTTEKQGTKDEARRGAASGCALDGVSVHIKGFAKMPKKTQEALASMIKHLVENEMKKPTGGAATPDAPEREWACNRCMYSWDGNGGWCPACGEQATHGRGFAHNRKLSDNS